MFEDDDRVGAVTVTASGSLFQASVTAMTKKSLVVFLAHQSFLSPTQTVVQIEFLQGYRQGSMGIG